MQLTDFPKRPQPQPPQPEGAAAEGAAPGEPGAARAASKGSGTAGAASSSSSSARQAAAAAANKTPLTATLLAALLAADRGDSSLMAKYLTEAGMATGNPNKYADRYVEDRYGDKYYVRERPDRYGDRRHRSRSQERYAYERRRSKSRDRHVSSSSRRRSSSRKRPEAPPPPDPDWSDSVVMQHLQIGVAHPAVRVQVTEQSVWLQFPLPGLLEQHEGAKQAMAEGLLVGTGQGWGWVLWLMCTKLRCHGCEQWQLH